MVLRYPKGIWLSSDRFKGFVQADYGTLKMAGDRLFMLVGRPVSWESRKQKTVGRTFID